MFSAAIDKAMREEAIADRGRRAAADLARRHQQEHADEDAAAHPAEGNTVFDPKEDRAEAKVLAKQAKEAHSQAAYHMKMGTASKKRGQLMAYEDSMKAYAEQQTKAGNLETQSKNLLERARATTEVRHCRLLAFPRPVFSETVPFLATLQMLKNAPKQSKKELEAEEEAEAAALEAEVAALEAEEENVKFDDEPLGNEEANPLATLSNESYEDSPFDDDSGGKKKKMSKKEKKAAKAAEEQAKKDAKEAAKEAKNGPPKESKDDKKQRKLIETWADSADSETLNPLAMDSEYDDAEGIERNDSNTSDGPFQIKEGMRQKGLMAKAAKVGNTGAAAANKLDKMMAVEKKGKVKKKKKKKTDDAPAATWQNSKPKKAKK